MALHSDEIYFPAMEKREVRIQQFLSNYGEELANKFLSMGGRTIEDLHSLDSIELDNVTGSVFNLKKAGLFTKEECLARIQELVSLFEASKDGGEIAPSVGEWASLNLPEWAVEADHHLQLAIDIQTCLRVLCGSNIGPDVKGMSSAFRNQFGTERAYGEREYPKWEWGGTKIENMTLVMSVIKAALKKAGAPLAYLPHKGRDGSLDETVVQIVVAEMKSKKRAETIKHTSLRGQKLDHSVVSYTASNGQKVSLLVPEFVYYESIRMARYLGGEYECNIGVIVRQLFSALKAECKPGVLEEYTSNFGYEVTVE